MNVQHSVKMNNRDTKNLKLFIHQKKKKSNSSCQIQVCCTFCPHEQNSAEQNERRRYVARLVRVIRWTISVRTSVHLKCPTQ